MKRILFSAGLLVIVLLSASRLAAQSQNAYKLPASFHFDYTETQMLTDSKHGDTCVMSYFYTKSGEYAGAKIEGMKKYKMNMFAVMDKDGYVTVFDEKKKSITTISMRKLMAEMGNMMKWIKMDSLMANFKKGSNGMNMQQMQMNSVKTGNTRKLGSYTEEEYTVSDTANHKASVWITKVDFATPWDFVMASPMGGMMKMMMMADKQGSHPLMQALMQSKTLLTGIDAKDPHNGDAIDLKTSAIAQVSTDRSTSGYELIDYTNKGFMDIMMAEMQRGH